jgi:hypothetical protein
MMPGPAQGETGGGPNWSMMTGGPGRCKRKEEGPWAVARQENLLSAPCVLYADSRPLTPDP